MKRPLLRKRPGLSRALRVGVFLAVAVAGLVRFSPPSSSQTACNFFNPSWNRSQVTITPSEIDPGGKFDVVWEAEPGNSTQVSNMDKFKGDTWSIELGGREVFLGKPPAPTPGKYEFRNLVAPGDISPGPSNVTLFHSGSKVWSCPVTINSPATTTTTPTTTPGTVDFSVACSPSALSANPGESAPSTCTVKSTGGFNKAVTLSCSGQPVGAACAFKPLTVTPPPNGSVNSALTVNVLGDAEPGDFSFQVIGTSGSTTRRAAMKLAITTEPVPPPPPNEPPTLPAPREEEIKLDRPSAEPGGELTVRGKGCDPNAPVEVFVDDEKAGSGEADSEGDFRVPIKLPEEAEVGRHEVAAECGPTLSTNVDVVIAVQAQAAAASVAPIATLAVLIFFMLELRRLFRREGAVTPRR